MKDKDRAKRDLINELVKLRQRVAQLEKAETECKGAEKLLLSSETKYKELIDFLPQTVFELDERGNFLFANIYGFEFTGYTQEDIDKGLNVLQILVPEDRDRVKKNMERILSGEKLGPNEYKILRKDGSMFPVIVYSNPIIRENKPIGFRGVLIDIIKFKQLAEELRIQSLIFNNIHDGVIVTDLESRIIGWNRAAERIFGYSRGEVFGKTTGFVKTSVVESTLHNGRWHGEIKFTRKDGTEGVCETIIVPMRDEQSNIIATVGVTRDITERKQAEYALLESEEKYRTLFIESKDAVYITTRDGSLVEFNQSFLNLFEYKKEEIKNINILKMYANHADRKRFQREIEKRESIRDFELKLRKKDGTEMDCLVTASLRKDAGGNILGYQGIIRDMTERKRQEQQLIYMATHDFLTNLPNRTLFNDRLTMALAHAKRNQNKVAVMLLDLDRFKDVNDNLGHNLGDKMLRVVGDRLKDILRKNDTVARLGGDEFMLLLPEVTRREHVAKIARKVLRAIREPLFLDGNELHVTTSIGIVIFPDDGRDIDTLLKNADTAMYHAKGKGRDNYQCYTSVINAED